LALAVALFAVRYGGHIAGGSDPSGTIGSLFALDRLLPNLARYPWSLIDSHFALLVLAGLGPLAIQNGLLSPSLEISRAARIAWSGPALFAALLGFCSLYLVFDEWLYVRFLLPMLPMLVALAAGLRRVPDSLSGLALLVTVALIVGGGLGRTVRLGATALRLSEARYVEAARFVEALPPDSVCLAMLHSGSLAYFTARPILRWDWIEAPETDRAVDALRAAGHAVYLVLDNLEEPRFRARFAGTRTVAALGRPLLTTTTPNIRAVVYRLSE
jgi:hypothetical protein